VRPPASELTADQLTPVVHEPTVRAQIMGAIPVKRGHTVLLNMVLAMGTLDSGTRDGADDGSRYYLLAREALRTDMLQGGSLPMVQGLCIMGNYLQRSGRPNAGYIAGGWALRMAMALGLHTPLPAGSGTPLERETRLRVWWCLATTEAGCSVTFGRPHMAGAFQLDATPLVVNCPDEDLTVMTEETPPPVDRATLYTALGYQSRLARVSCAILDRILHSNPAPSIRQLRRYDRRILDTVAAMPAYMGAKADPGPHQLALHVQRWRTRHLRSILYTPLLLGVAWRSHPQLALAPDVLEAIE
jgi:transcriptional regulatory protein GAL4